MYKLIVIDLDGTLLNSYGEISPKNREAIKKAIKYNYEIILASGRIPSSVKDIALDLGINNYFISGNGSIIYNLQNDELIYKKTIEPKKVLEVIKKCEENSIFYSMHTKNGIITKSLNYNVLGYYNENLKKKEDKKTNISIIDSFYNYLQKDNEIYKITIADSNKIVFSNILKKIKKIDKLSILEVDHVAKRNIMIGSKNVEMEYYYTEITGECVNKWYALEYLANMLNIEKNEIIAIGDNYNDRMMIENAGFGIAMENGTPYIKENADYVTTSCENDGVAEAINYILH